MIRVLIAEDSVTVRELLVNLLAADPEIEIAGTVKDGLEAVEATKRLRPDVVTMDINMPVMDGFEATKRIMIEAPVPIVIISGTVDVRDVTISMNALRVGALALLEKPSLGSVRFQEDLRHLVSTVKAMAAVKVIRHWPTRPAPAPPLPISGKTRPTRVRAIAMAASTGGPAALSRVLSELPAQFPVPVLVVQHIARGFVQGLTSWLDAVCNVNVKIAEDGEALASSTVYLAGDDRHLGLSKESRVVLADLPPIDGFRPSATHLFQSVGNAFGPAAVAVMLTGMGQDGVEGLRALRAAGGRVLVQDAASSIVFGMPGAAIGAGLAHHIVPLTGISEMLLEIVGETRSAKHEE